MLSSYSHHIPKFIIILGAAQIYFSKSITQSLRSMLSGSFENSGILDKALDLSTSYIQNTASAGIAKVMTNVINVMRAPLEISIANILEYPQRSCSWSSFKTETLIPLRNLLSMSSIIQATGCNPDIAFPVLRIFSKHYTTTPTTSFNRDKFAKFLARTTLDILKPCAIALILPKNNTSYIKLAEFAISATILGNVLNTAQDSCLTAVFGK